MADWSAAEAYVASYAKQCAVAAPALLDLVGPPRGRLLDVGSGPGTVAAAAALRGWAVDAVEPDAAMRSAASRLHGLAVIDGALPDLPVARAAFHAVVAAFVVNHLPDPRQGVRGLIRAAVPGARVAISVWPSAPSPVTRFWDAVIERAQAVRPTGLRLAPALDFERSAAGTSALLQGAGLAEVRAEEVDGVFEVRPEDLWAATEGGIAIAGTTYRAQGADGRRRMRDAFRAETRHRTTGGSLRFPVRAVVAVGTIAR